MILVCRRKLCSCVRIVIMICNHVGVLQSTVGVNGLCLDLLTLQAEQRRYGDQRRASLPQQIESCCSGVGKQKIDLS